MTKKQILAHYKSGAAVGRAVGLSRYAFFKWTDPPPLSYQYMLETLTRQKLRVEK